MKLLPNYPQSYSNNINSIIRTVLSERNAKKIKKMIDKLKGFLERHNYKITLTIIKFLKILGKNHCEEAITEI